MWANWIYVVRDLIKLTFRTTVLKIQFSSCRIVDQELRLPALGFASFLYNAFGESVLLPANVVMGR